MTWRAFIIGLLGVVGLNLLVPVNDYAVGNTFLTGNHFPVGVVFFLLILVLVVNVLVRLARRAWALRRSELMLVWCMMIVSATIPASGLMRYLLPAVAAPPYMAQRADIFWEDTVLKEAPDGLLLSRDARSVSAREFYLGTPKGERVTVPWDRWAKVFLTWGVFLTFYYLGTLLLFGILRKQWVEVERLTFPLARVPLELTQGAEHSSLLPALFHDRTFLVGSAVTVAFGLVRILPILFGGRDGWLPSVPIRAAFVGTPWESMGMDDGRIFPIAIGFAFLVPSDVSLSIWLFYVLSRVQVIVGQSVGYGEAGWWAPFSVWRQAGAYVVFSVVLLWMARRHLITVLRRALGLVGGEVDDQEPIGYRFGFWGLLICLAGMVGWYVYLGMGVRAALALLGALLCLVLVNARLVAQGGMFFVQKAWGPPDIVHDISGGHAFSAAGAVVAQAQHMALTNDVREIFGPHAINALRISAVFEKHRHWFVPAMVAALVVGALAAGYASLRWVYYDVGGINILQPWSVVGAPTHTFNRAHQMISNPAGSARINLEGFLAGGGVMLVLMLMRHNFYWWPVHSLGFLVTPSYAISQLWFSFLIGWGVKFSLMKFAGGGALRSGRKFFLAAIIAESAVIGTLTFISLFSGVRFGYIFLPQ